MKSYIKKVNYIQKTTRITIPKPIVDEMEIKPQDSFVVATDGEKILMAPLNKEYEIRYGLAVDRALRKYGAFLDAIEEDTL